MVGCIGDELVKRRTGGLAARDLPGWIEKGKKMPGQYGNTKVTVQNLTIVKIDAENNLIAVKGAIPGPKNGTVTICDSVKKKA